MKKTLKEMEELNEAVKEQFDDIIFEIRKNLLCKKDLNKILTENERKTIRDFTVKLFEFLTMREGNVFEDVFLDLDEDNNEKNKWLKGVEMHDHDMDKIEELLKAMQSLGNLKGVYKEMEVLINKSVNLERDNEIYKERQDDDERLINKLKKEIELLKENNELGKYIQGLHKNNLKIHQDLNKLYKEMEELTIKYNKIQRGLKWN